MAPSCIPPEAMRARVLDIGCGARKLPGSTGVDVVPGPGVDLVADLSHGTWPVQEGSVDVVVATHILEHIPLMSTMAEIHRILRPGGYAWIRVPHASYRDFWKDPTHLRPFTLGTFDYWTPGYRPDYGLPGKFRILHKSLHLYGYLEHHRFDPRWAWLAEPLRRAIDAAAALRPGLCERLWAPMVGGFTEAEFVLEKV